MYYAIIIIMIIIIIIIRRRRRRRRNMRASQAQIVLGYVKVRWKLKEDAKKTYYLLGGLGMKYVKLKHIMNC